MYKQNHETRPGHVNLRMPLRILARVDDLAEERYDSNRTNALLALIERGLETLAPSRVPQQEG